MMRAAGVPDFGQAWPTAAAAAAAARLADPPDYVRRFGFLDGSLSRTRFVWPAHVPPRRRPNLSGYANKNNNNNNSRRPPDDSHQLREEIERPTGESNRRRNSHKINAALLGRRCRRRRRRAAFNSLYATSEVNTREQLER